MVLITWNARTVFDNQKVFSLFIWPLDSLYKDMLTARNTCWKLMSTITIDASPDAKIILTKRKISMMWQKWLTKVQSLAFTTKEPTEKIFLGWSIGTISALILRYAVKIVKIIMILFFRTDTNVLVAGWQQMDIFASERTRMALAKMHNPEMILQKTLSIERKDSNLILLEIQITRLWTRDTRRDSSHANPMKETVALTVEHGRPMLVVRGAEILTSSKDPPAASAENDGALDIVPIRKEFYHQL